MNTLTAPQLKALELFKAKHGRAWKSKLRALWSRGKDDQVPMIGAYLRQIRNEHAHRLGEM